MSEIPDENDPDKTRLTPVPPPARRIPSSPADGPTRFIPVTPPRRAPHPPGQPAHPPARIPPPPPLRPLQRPPAPPPRPAAPPRVDRGHNEPPGELPWWQTINRDRPPKPPPVSAPPAAPPAAPVKRAPPSPPPPPPAAPTASSSSKAWWWITAFAGMAVLIAGTALVLALTGTRTPAKVLDIATTQRQVEQILRDPLEGYGAGTVTGVVCNSGVNPTISRGSEFSCAATVDGTQRRIAVVFQDDDGTYAVDRPR